MKIFKPIVTLMAAACVTLPAAAEVEWLSKDYNFGTIKEEDGKVTGSVQLVNHGPESTYINRVRPSCGCTGASYTHKMIEPGDTATISFTYNPQGRPGPFDKTVKVYMGEDNDLSVIRITGRVIGSSTTLDKLYPFECGPLRLESKLLPAGELKRGSTRHLFLNVYNQGDKPITPSWENPSDVVSVELKPSTLKPGESGTFTFCVTSSKEPGTGPFDYPVKIYPAGKRGEETIVTVSSVIVPDSRTIPLDELEQAPQAFLLPEFIDLGVKEGDNDVEFEFEVTNEGKSDLKVERVYSRDSRIEISEVPDVVKEGEKRQIKGKLKASELEAGPFRLKAEVVTNDPLHPLRSCSIVGIKVK